MKPGALRQAPPWTPPRPARSPSTAPPPGTPRPAPDIRPPSSTPSRNWPGVPCAEPAPSTWARAPASPPGCSSTGAPGSSPSNRAPAWRANCTGRSRTSRSCADGDRLPLAAACADLITYAQSWHWTDPGLSAPEALRVLRPGGALALWWNVSDHSVPWIAEQDVRLRRFFGVDRSAHGSPDDPPRLPPEFGQVRRSVPWARTVSLDTHLANLGTHSAFLVLGDEAARRFLHEERERLSELFPDGTIEECYVVELVVAIRP